MNQFQSFDKSFDFILSLSIKEKSILETFISQTCFVWPEKAITVLDGLENKEKFEAAEYFVRVFLAYGDIDAAQKVINALPIQHPTHQLLTLQTELFSQMFSDFENAAKVDFPMLIKEGLNRLNILHEHPKKEVNRIIEMMSDSGSFAEALKVANNLNNENLKGFARSGLSHCGLDSLSYAAKENAKKVIEERDKEDTAEIIRLTEESIETGNFHPIFSYISTLKSSKVIQFANLSVACVMCNSRQYDSAYALVKAEQEKGLFIESYQYKGSLEVFQSFCEANGDLDWMTKFSELTLNE